MDYTHEEGVDDQENQEKVFSLLNKDLRSDLIFDVYKRNLLKVKFIKESFSNNEFILRKLCEKMEERVYMPNEEILKPR